MLPTTFGPENTPYDALGGESRVRALVDAFYAHMDQDADLKETRGLYPQEIDESREKLFEFLSGWLGGPQLYISKYGHPRLRGRHMPFPIGDLERDQWMTCMGRAMDDCNLEGDIRAFLEQRFRHVADFMRNR